MPRDLSDPVQGPHAVQLLLDRILAALDVPEVRLIRENPEVAVEDNYDNLGYTPDAVTRDARYTRYTTPGRMLRSHTSAMIPPALRVLGTEEWDDVVLACVGMVYRRDTVDRVHSGTPHQLDLWRISRHQADLDELIDTVVRAALPGVRYRTVPATHPYTTAGRQIDVLVDGEWLEVGECGLAASHVLRRAWLPSGTHGLAMGLGLDRLLMLHKGVPDIRLLSATDPRVASQMLDLTPYRPVSKHPPVLRDISVAVDVEQDAETIGDVVRSVLGELVEAVHVVSETPVSELPPAAVARLGAVSGQKNVLLRLVLRHLTRTLTDEEANAARDAVYAAVHAGTSSSAGVPSRA
ncbi:MULTISPECIES: PheS-related mystery ligase SrmL [unclassified Saccharothrix]|uniref:PheS-related mystery ligase SrmL n=1 Tax=unclassified Saccharothrix TaxID=2593673 RepID=UPI00307FC645